jgi:heme exporter protein C
MLTRLVALTGLGYLLVVAGLAINKSRGGSQAAGRPILPIPWEHPLGGAGLLLFIIGNWLGLFYTPPEKFMGDVGRILYVHVPAAWIAMICFALATLFAFLYLMFSSRRGLDSAMEAAVEVGVLEGSLLLVLGAIFAKPTWGVWWSWDARLTSSAVMVLSFVGVLLLRGVVRDSDRRATWSAVATILAGVNLPVTYMSVKWFRSIHQMPSETMQGSTIDTTMRWVLYLNTWALLFITVWLLAQRWRLAEVRAEADMPDPLPEVAT